jgi:glycosyltransferase involved in cell wall biosynthesis
MGINNPTVSVCMIVKNEENNINRCLDSLCWADEIIIVDTGSTDKTKKIIEDSKVKVKYYTTIWEDDFSKARNFSMDKATKNYILWVDADEEVIGGEYIKKCLRQNPGKYLMLPLSFYNADDKKDVLQLRIVPNRFDIRFNNRVHEQLSLAVEKAKLEEVFFTDTKIIHYGYTSVEVSNSKLERNLRLLRMDIKDNPNNAWLWSMLAQTLYQLGRFSETREVIEKAIELTNVEKVKEYFQNMLYQLNGSKSKTLSIVLVSEGKKHLPDVDKVNGYEITLCPHRTDMINAAIRKSSGNYIVLMTDDFILTKDWDVELLDVFNAKEDIAIVGPVSNGLLYSQRVNGKVTEEDIEEFSKKLRLKYKDTCVLTDFLDSSFIVINKKIIEDVGLFDEDFEYNEGAGADLCKRVIKNGLNLCICADVFVYRKEEVIDNDRC